jgi:hypothetical protein
MTPKEDTMNKLLLKLYVWCLNRDPGTKLSIWSADGDVQVRGPMRHMVTVGTLYGKPRSVAKVLYALDRKAQELLATTEPVLRTVASMIDQGVPVESIRDALDELRIQYKEGRV